MDDIGRRLAEIRRRVASKSRQSFYSTANFNAEMTDFNSKVDLRPSWMISDDSQPSGKPHVNSVLQPEQRGLGIPRSIPKLSADQLKSVSLRKTGIRDSIDQEGSRTKEDCLRGETPTIAQPQAIRPNVFNFQVETPSLGMNQEAPTPPPLPGFKMSKIGGKLSNLNENINKPNFGGGHLTDGQEAKLAEALRIINANAMSSRTSIIDDKLRQLRELEARSEALERGLKETLDLSSKAVKNDAPTTGKRNSGLTNSDSGYQTKFDERELEAPGMYDWIKELIEDKFERLSMINYANQNDEKVDSSSRTRNISSNKGEKNDHDVSKKRSRSRGRTRNRSPSIAESLRSERSKPRSVKSVLFSRTEEEELCSEVDDDDIVNINSGNVGFIDSTSDKFTIHGPFVDKELNVFHEVCIEYQRAAEMSFAKRTPFARTNPAHERVYALLGSNRRSGWTNRNNWVNIQSDLQVLDYLFRRIIRSKSRRIKEPVMELEHFSSGSTLDQRRFYKIVRSIFFKRDRLLRSLGIIVEQFDSIK